ncbi:MAG TPA: DUF4440 domain-containing protein [Candidatus Polarisedimenticolia bacterium]|nr:DUF4440 domain-containing protein [Candidatus Polarisedimenticolia bacterium]
MRFRAATALILCLAPCAAACHLPLTPSARYEMIGRLRERLTAAFNAGDVAAILALWTDDGVALTEDHPPIVGRTALRAYYESLLHEPGVQVSLLSEEVVDAGEWAFDRGTINGTVTRAGHKPVIIIRKYLLVLRRQPDGGWKIGRAISNGNGPPAGPFAGPPTTTPGGAPAPAPSAAAEASPTVAPSPAPTPAPTPTPGPSLAAPPRQD